MMTMRKPEISIIIPSKTPTLLRQCLASLVYIENDNYEVSKIDTSKDGSATLFSDRLPGATFAQACNYGVREARGDYLLLLNDDIILTSDIITPLLAIGQQTEAIIGARLLYPNGLIQHAGIGFDSDGGPYNLWNLAPGEHPEAMKPRSLPAVTFACAFMPKSIWQDLGGLDEGYKNAYEDVDFCLRYREQGGLVLYDPTISAVHLEGQTEGRNAHVAESWQHFESIWTKTGRIHYILGSWPFSVARQ